MSLRITNEYGELPPFTNWHIKKSLEWIPPLDFYGIEHIRLVDKISESTINLTTEQKKIEDCIVSGIRTVRHSFCHLEILHLF